MTYEEAIEILNDEIVYPQLPLYLREALKIAIECIEKQIEISKAQFTHICKSDRDPYPTAFSIYARVIERDENTVTVERFIKFGSIPMGKVTISKKEFDRCYKEIEIFNLEKFMTTAPESLINIKFNNKLIQSTVKFIKHKELSLIESRNLIELLIKWSNEIEEEIEKTGV